jgi:hypothetical protein
MSSLEKQTKKVAIFLAVLGVVCIVVSLNI